MAKRSFQSWGWLVDVAENGQMMLNEMNEELNGWDMEE